MKVFVCLLAVFCTIQATLAWTEDLPSNPDLIACINAKTEGLVVDVEDLAGWTEDVQATLNRLADQRRRCNNLPRYIRNIFLFYLFVLIENKSLDQIQ